MKNVLFSMVIGLGMMSQANAFAGDAQAGKTKAAVCAACHGSNGMGTADTYPNLAGQHADYIVKQLKAFKAGDRKDALMSPMAANLSEQDMADVAAYFSSFSIDGSAPSDGDSAAQTATAAPAPKYIPDAAAGKALYEHGDADRGITACITCHGKDGDSKVLINPNLSNQHPEYIEKQLKNFKEKSRHNASMNQVSANLSTEDIANLGAYFEDPKSVGDVKASTGKVAVKNFVGDVALGKAKSATCVACHNADGNSTNAMYPSIAGQGEAYLYKQLVEFKSGERDNAIMAGMVGALSEDDMQNLAAYFASQTLKPVAAKANVLGKELYTGGDAARGITTCIACHSVDGKGMDSARFPAIGGQHPSYLASQLNAFRSGTRANDLNGMMQDIAAKLTDEEIKALADYASTLK
ncbi:c-type cytochrome [Thalassotalea sediminis]|uniref:c-type cytochrome n=1 Tax=Thalassotalea sediminis TaxID=1759089 RepID=UPI0025744E05|nr:c-type cytochrome [Thalassotalea sediminis]